MRETAAFTLQRAGICIIMQAIVSVSASPIMDRSQSYNNILLIKPGAIGDVLQLTPVVRALAEQFPGKKISLLLGSPATAELFKHNPHLHETILFDKKGTHRSVASLLKLWQTLRRAATRKVIANAPIRIG